MHIQAGRFVPVVLSAILLALDACSSSFGGGSAPPKQPAVVILPQGEKIVCNDGTAPPCR